MSAWTNKSTKIIFRRNAHDSWHLAEYEYTYEVGLLSFPQWLFRVEIEIFWTNKWTERLRIFASSIQKKNRKTLLAYCVWNKNIDSFLRTLIKSGIRTLFKCCTLNIYSFLVKWRVNFTDDEVENQDIYSVFN